ncbi:hypothetical protein ElyMa_006428600 [Elysia marginata]|uniref:Uncharacterized protein n=1 Tax=Elysia marginata TaxID=1093978 RepID=A0AAV4HUU9_9GAST|nr:hypothetical protein ElyMa_006428600 [Elysia marginata]
MPSQNYSMSLLHFNFFIPTFQSLHSLKSRHRTSVPRSSLRTSAWWHKNSRIPDTSSMLNQLEHGDPLHECSKSSLGSSAAYCQAETDSTTEGNDPSCSRKKTKGSFGKTKRNVNQRAKVTVLRKANRPTNQQVVSLSFNKAIELTSFGGKDFLGTTALENEKVERPEDEQMPHRAADCDAASSISHDENQANASSQDISNYISIPQTEKPESLSHEDEVFSFSSTTEESQNIAPPPIRLRQAWASPTPVRQQRTSSAKESKATNTEKKRDKSNKSLRPAPETSAKNKDLGSQPDSEIKSEDHSYLEEQPGLETVGSVKEVADQTTNIAPQSKQKKKKRIDVKIPQAHDYCTAEEPGVQNRPNNNTTAKEKMDKKTGPENEYEADTITIDKNTAETKSHGMGDAEIAHKIDMHQPVDERETNFGETDTPTNNTKANNQKVKTNRTKKAAASLFSWHPFKKKSHLKQKSNEPGLDEVVGKTAGKTSFVAKTSMTDALYKQSRVAMSQTLTEMFAASHPEKIAAVHRDNPGPK